MKINFKRIMFIVCYIITCFLFLIKAKAYTEGYIDIYIIGIIALVSLFIGSILYSKKKISNKIKIGIFLVALGLFVSYPLYNDYLVYAHDINFHLVRIEGLKESLSNFQIPARIHPIENNGYGYATSMFYPELFLYIPAILRLINTSMVFSYKLFLVLINIVAVFCMYLSVKNISKSTTAGIIGAIIYAVANYRLENIFTRAALGEALALAFFPLVIWGLYELCIGNKKKWYIFAIGITCVMQSHILSIFFAGIICLVFGLRFIRNIIKEKRYKTIILSLIVILLLNMWFIVPFLDGYKLDLKVKNIDENSTAYVFYKYTVIPAQLFNIFDSAYSLNLSIDNELGMENEMSYTLGILCSLGLIISVIYCLKNRNNNDNTVKLIKLLTGISIVFIILSTTIIPWKELQDEYEFIEKICMTMQFGWRFLGISTFTIVIATSIIIGKYVDSKCNAEGDFIENYKIVLVIALIAFLAMPLFLGEYSKQFKFITNSYELNYDLAGQGEYFIDGTDTRKLVENKYVTSSSKIKVNDYNKEGCKIVMNYENNEGSGYIEVPLLYYPGYVAKDENGKKLEISCGDNNVLRVELTEAKNGTITVNYKEKALYIVSDVISIITLGVFLVFLHKKDK